MGGEIEREGLTDTKTNNEAGGKKKTFQVWIPRWLRLSGDIKQMSNGFSLSLVEKIGPDLTENPPPAKRVLF